MEALYQSENERSKNYKTIKTDINTYPNIK